MSCRRPGAPPGAKAIVNLVPLAEGEKIAALRGGEGVRAAKKDDEEDGSRGGARSR